LEYGDRAAPPGDGVGGIDIAVLLLNAVLRCFLFNGHLGLA
jgi:hypothetical protein